MEIESPLSSEVKKEKKGTEQMFLPTETTNLQDDQVRIIDKRLAYFQQILEKIDDSKEKELELFSAVAMDLLNVWISQFNTSEHSSLSKLDDVERFLEWYCQPLEIRLKAKTIVSFPFSDTVRFTAVLLLGKLGYLVREAAKDEHKHTPLKKITSIHEFLRSESNDLFISFSFPVAAAAD